MTTSFQGGEESQTGISGDGLYRAFAPRLNHSLSLSPSPATINSFSNGESETYPILGSSRDFFCRLRDIPSALLRWSKHPRRGGKAERTSIRAFHPRDDFSPARFSRTRLGRTGAPAHTRAHSTSLLAPMSIG